MHLFGLFLLCLTFYIGHMTEVQMCRCACETGSHTKWTVWVLKWWHARAQTYRSEVQCDKHYM